MDIVVTQTLKEQIIYLSGKRTMLKESLDGITSIAVGSSHGDFGFNPAYCPGAFNLCSRSQDLKHSFHLYKKISQASNRIKNIIVFYSIFSPGNIMELSTTEKEICPAINELFQLDIKYDDKIISMLSAGIKGRLDTLDFRLDGYQGFMPSDGKGYFFESYGVKRRVGEHLKCNKNNYADIYLVRILLLAKLLGHNAYIVIPPARSDYRAAVGAPFDHLFRSLLEILNDFPLEHKPSLINLFDSDIFRDEHFGDFDHLLTHGAGVALMSGMINQAIK